MDVLALDDAVGVGLGAEDDAGRHAEAVGRESQPGGILLVVAGELGGLHELRHPPEAVTREEDVLVVAGRAAVGVGAVLHGLGDGDDLLPLAVDALGPRRDLVVDERQVLAVDDGAVGDVDALRQLGVDLLRQRGDRVGVAGLELLGQDAGVGVDVEAQVAP